MTETMGVAILMNGGPPTMYGPRAFQAFQAFTAGAPWPELHARRPRPSRSCMHMSLTGLEPP